MEPNRIEVDQYLCSQLFFQWCQDNSMGERIIFSTYDLEKLDIHVKNNIDCYSELYRKINLKWINNLNLKNENY